MKKVLLIILIIIILAIAAILGIGFGLGLGPGNGKGSEGTNIVQNNTSNDDSVEVKEEKNSENDGIVTYRISVVENEYFYENERISLDDFISTIKEEKSVIRIEIKDDSASKKAYDDLIDSLKELDVMIVEEN